MRSPRQQATATERQAETAQRQRERRAARTHGGRFNPENRYVEASNDGGRRC